MTCVAVGVDDRDGDPVGLLYAWALRTASGPILTLPPTTDTLDVAILVPGDSVFCTITPDDGFDNGLPVDSATALVSNLVPSIASVAVTPAAPQVGDSLTCTLTNIIDPEADPVTESESNPPGVALAIWTYNAPLLSV